MIKDITLGQYFPGNSIVHRLDPRYKIIISGIFIAMLFIGDHVICLEIGAFCRYGAYPFINSGKNDSEKYKAYYTASAFYIIV